MSRIREQYVNTGKVRFVYKHFAILGSESTRAAEASECAAEQDQFWAYHDRVFADQLETRSTLRAERLTELAAEIGLDTTAFDECLSSGRYTGQISQEKLSVQSLGVRGTPAFLINGGFVSGAQPFEVFQQVFEQQLAQSQGATNPTPAGEEVVEQTAPPLPTTTKEPVREDDIDGVVFFPDPGKNQQEGEIDYPETVPPGGMHSDGWQNCGIYDEPVPLDPTVHSLEHGAVWIAYQPDLPSDQVELLRTLVRQEQQARGEALVLLAPMSGDAPMDASIVVTAWQVQLQLDDASDERLPKFLSRYQNGPFTPEPGASCSGSLGEPLE